MGDKIAQLIFEKIKTPAVKEVNSLEGTGHGDRGYGSIEINADKSELIQDIKNSSTGQINNLDQKTEKTQNQKMQSINE